VPTPVSYQDVLNSSLHPITEARKIATHVGIARSLGLCCFQSL